MSKLFEPEDKSKVRLEYFSENKMRMLLEARKHPALDAVAGRFNQREQWPEIVAEIGAYCNVFLNGSYMPHELEHLYGVLADKLAVMPILLGVPTMVEEEDLDFSKYEQREIYSGGKN